MGKISQLGVSDRRTLLKASLFGVGAMLTGSSPSRGDDRSPTYPDQVPEHWVIDDTSAVADTESGRVVGYVRNGVSIFKGIPYAEVLSPEDRWKRGSKVRSWTGKRSSRAQGFACPGTEDVNSAGPLDEVAFHNSDAEVTRSAEDCLRVNVWTPGVDDKKRQVLFYIHGGGFTHGSSLMSLKYEAHNLARYGDVVVVSMNHRLNALGFLDLTAYGPQYEDSANLSMLDIVDALKWVQRNIANFGGDPAEVMIFGHSGGGSKVMTMLSVPEAKGLFNRAVAQSGAPMVLSTQEQAAARTASYLKLVGVSPANVEALHKLPLETLIRAASVLNSAFTRARDRYDGWGTPDAENGWRPVIDGRVVMYNSPLPTAVSDVPLMIGNALHEQASALGHPEYFAMKEEEARKAVKVAFGPDGDSIYDIYRGAFPKASPYEISSMARAMGHFRADSIKIAQRRAAQNAAPTYNYWIHWRANIFEGRAMSHHEIEIPLILMNSDEVPMVTGGDAQAREMSLKMADAWLAFARTGNPNTKALPPWAPVTPTKMTTMVFDNTCSIDHGSDLAAIEMYWKDRYPRG